jgi:hypothetical protein
MWRGGAPLQAVEAHGMGFSSTLVGGRKSPYQGLGGGGEGYLDVAVYCCDVRVLLGGVVVVRHFGGSTAPYLGASK